MSSISIDLLVNLRTLAANHGLGEETYGPDSMDALYEALHWGASGEDDTLAAVGLPDYYLDDEPDSPCIEKATFGAVDPEAIKKMAADFNNITKTTAKTLIGSTAFCADKDADGMQVKSPGSGNGIDVDMCYEAWLCSKAFGLLANIPNIMAPVMTWPGDDSQFETLLDETRMEDITAKPEDWAILHIMLTEV